MTFYPQITQAMADLQLFFLIGKSDIREEERQQGRSCIS